MRDKLFGQGGDLGVREIGKIQIGLLVFHEAEIKSAFTFMASIGADYGEPAHQAGRISRSIQTERGEHDAVAATSTLHQEIAIPLVGQGERKVDAKFLAPNSGASIDDALDSAICRYGSTVAWSVEIRHGGSISNRFGFRDFGLYDFNARSFKALQGSARVCLLGLRTSAQQE